MAHKICLTAGNKEVVNQGTESRWWDFGVENERIHDHEEF